MEEGIMKTNPFFDFVAVFQKANSFLENRLFLFLIS